MSQDKSKSIEENCIDPGGYPQLAGYMNFHPELGIFRRFGALATETLLYYQAEISQIELRLRAIQAEDRASDDTERKLYGLAWPKLVESARSSRLRDSEREQEQFKLIMHLREVMGQYQQALYFHERTLALRKPHKKLLQDLRSWMKDSTLGRIRILSCDWKTWEPSMGIEDDLITFENSTMDQFTFLITYTVIDVYHNLIGRYIHKPRGLLALSELPITETPCGQMITYSHKTVALFTRIIAVLLSCIFPIAAILVLYVIQDMRTRLGIVACFTMLFSTSMSVFTMGSVSEIFSATAAFAAVLVVFVGATNNGGNT